jgi:hypothetical protein
VNKSHLKKSYSNSGLLSLFRLFATIFILNACSTLSSSNSTETFFKNNMPLQVREISRFSTVDRLPGLPFSPNFNLRVDFNKEGNLLLEPGDYLIPVMTYCMNSKGSSPDAHSYILSQMQGSRARIIRDLNLRALPQFSYEDVQILSWSLQNGLKYDDLTAESKNIVNTVLPEYKEALRDSLLETLEKKWNDVAAHSDGIVPSLADTSDNALARLGETGSAIAVYRSFQNTLKEVGNNYQLLSQRIRVLKKLDSKTEDTPWSHVSENVYVRFITSGHYQDLGQVQIRVVAQSSARKPNLEIARETVDLLSWLADPKDSGVQPLSFSPIYGFGGVLVLPALSEAPALALAVLGAVLAAGVVDWEAFQKLSQLLRDVKDQEVQNKIADGNRVLNEIHDKLEKPLREKGIIDKTTKKISSNDNNPTRQYEKPGGQKVLDKDFEKLDGPSQKADDVEVKEAGDGVKAVKRPPSKKGQAPTLEMQPEKTGNRIDDSARVKVRYK